MAKELFGFKITNNDADFTSNSREGYMLYVKNKNLTPIKENFSIGHPDLMTPEEVLIFLKDNRTRELKTYNPTSSYINSMPYETKTEEDWEAIEITGRYDKFEHFRIEPESKLGNMINQAQISLKILNKKEKEALEKELDLYEY